jgi:hypothetical protein
LSQIFVARYEYALVLRPETTALTNFEPPKESLPVKKITENYRVAPPGKDSELEVVSEFHGVEADDARKRFRNTNQREIQQHYLDYYVRMFPDAKVQKSVWYEELPGEDGCRVTESYVLGSIWKLNQEDDRYTLLIEPGDIYSAIPSVTSTQRTSPIRIEYPNIVVEEINLEMFEDWPLNAKANTTTTEFFRLRDEPNATGSQIRLNYSYESLKDRAEVSELSKFNQEVSDAKDSLNYKFSYQTPEQLAKTHSGELPTWVIIVAIAVVLGGVGAVALTVVLYWRYSRRAA